jgi:hypothetical protein
MASHWIAVIVLFLVVAGAMALAWPHRNKSRNIGSMPDLSGPGTAMQGGEHHHAGGDGFSAHD